MNLLPLAALLIATLSLALSITALTAARRPLPKPVRRRQYQAGGSYVAPHVELPEDWEAPSAALIAKQAGRHL